MNMKVLKTRIIYALKVVCIVGWWILAPYLFLMSPKAFAEGMEEQMGVRT